MRCSPCRGWRALAMLCLFLLAGARPLPVQAPTATCTFVRVCFTCNETKKCSLCDRLLEESHFSQPQSKQKHGRRRVCTACQKRGQWTCYVCKTRRLQSHFSRWERTRRCGHNGQRTCNTCIDMAHARQRANARLK